MLTNDVSDCVESSPEEFFIFSPLRPGRGEQRHLQWVEAGKRRTARKPFTSLTFLQNSFGRQVEIF